MRVATLLALVACWLAFPAVGNAQFESEGSFLFGSRNLEVATPNGSGNYTMVHHVNEPAGYDAIAYDADQGWGFEVLNPGATGRNTSARFGPFDDSPNGRDNFADTLPDEIYDSFIGFKNHPQECNVDTIGDATTPCESVLPPSGGIFRVDVPNGLYRFVGAFGEADNPHAHRVLVEDGGEGGPGELGPNHVTLVHNHDQAQFDIGEAVPDEPGSGVFARVGFDGFLPPEPEADGPKPVFVDMDANGMPTDGGPDSPLLEVTQGYLRLHLLQGNSNPGVSGDNDPNGPDIVVFEAIAVPEPSSVLLSLLGFVGLLAARRRR